MSLKVFLKHTNKWFIGLVVAATAVSSLIAFYSISQFETVNKTSSSRTVATKLEVKKVTALGRLEPEAEVINLSAPLALDGDRLVQLLVKESDKVKTGQVIAILDSRDKLQKALLQVQEQVKMAEAKLAQVKAGAKAGEISAQKAAIERLQAQLQGDRVAQQQTIARLEAQWQGDRSAQEATIRRLLAELNNAQAEYQRHLQLYKEGAISGSSFDSKRLSLETAKQQISEAKAVLNRINTTASKQISEAKAVLNRINTTASKEINQAKAILNSIAEVRPVNIRAAQAEVDNAVAALKRAQTDLQQAYIKSPIAGQILKVHTRVGEKISNSGIVDLAQTDQMMAVAEVYQTDVGKVKVGQKATVTSPAIEGKLQGTVFQIGLQVNRQNVFSNQPGENLDRRVVEVKIRLNPKDNKQVASFTNLQVQTAIEL